MITSYVNNRPLRQREVGLDRSRQAVRKVGPEVGSNRVQDAEAAVSVFLLVGIVLVLVFQALA
jgi:preprotein translocase subunit SecF